MKYEIQSSIPAILLCTVVGFHSYLSLSRNLTPWKGGGFAMFSTTDTPGYRNLRVFAVLDNKKYPVLLPSSFKGEVNKIRALPSKESISILCDNLFDRRWIPINTEQKDLSSGFPLSAFFDIYDLGDQNTDSPYSMALYHNSDYAVLSENSKEKQGILPQEFEIQLWKSTYSNGKVKNILLSVTKLKR